MTNWAPGALNNTLCMAIAVALCSILLNWPVKRGVLCELKAGHR